MDHSSRKRPAPPPQDEHSRRIFRNELNGQSAWDRHKMYVSRYLKVYERDGGKARQAQLDAKNRNDWDVLKERHRFLRDDEEEGQHNERHGQSGSRTETEYENEVAKRYYNHLFKEYAIADMKHYKTGNLALRWRSEDDVVDGIGQFSECSLSLRQLA
jgi:protein FRA10AC1